MLEQRAFITRELKKAALRNTKMLPKSYDEVYMPQIEYIERI